MSGLHLVHVSRRVLATELREATTGRPVAVPRIWAVAEHVSAQPRRDPAEAMQALIAEGQPVPPKLELAFYRKYTEAMLRRYLRLSMEVGRVPSLMGREMFRGHVSHYKMDQASTTESSSASTSNGAWQSSGKQISGSSSGSHSRATRTRRQPRCSGSASGPAL